MDLSREQTTWRAAGVVLLQALLTRDEVERLRHSFDALRAAGAATSQQLLYTHEAPRECRATAGRSRRQPRGVRRTSAEAARPRRESVVLGARQPQLLSKWSVRETDPSGRASCIEHVIEYEGVERRLSCERKGLRSSVHEGGAATVHRGVHKKGGMTGQPEGLE